MDGPLDAVALTLAGDGQTVGVALLGTALTDRQADLLRRHLRGDGPGVLVATDADAAGEQAAERMYWQLTAVGDHPRRLALPGGLDPADLLHREGAAALRTAVESAGHLADLLLGRRLQATSQDRSPAAVRETVRDTAAIVAASPPARWLDRIDRVTQALRVPPGTVHRAVLDAGRVPGLPPSSSSSRRPRQASRSAPAQAPGSAPSARRTPARPTTARTPTTAGRPTR